ncbi:uncharacterized protein F4807DRAFT_413185 [Annulohypoxylon truncatum]|uniref:uncharacterized protein n=1 Tax=Annulohypoxylon truncatum TaxID=327061 RepID=UPI00200733C3|nr:uncharacterized protein F4807DRAFT_413185 [Annulohypoxylon truncatum]KAI1213182.1 hypothetical protein F4807DRAFT_413185 [Annulohypoxylon truncatum]
MFAGDISRWNRGGLLRHTVPHRYERAHADFKALTQALDVVADIRSIHPDLAQVRISSNSMCLVDLVAIWMWEWKQTGGRMASRRIAKHHGGVYDFHVRLEGIWYGGLTAMPSSGIIDIQDESCRQ